jgi:hypothetical protein
VVQTGDNNLVLPAVIGCALLKERNSSYHNELLSLSVNMLLPELLIRQTTLAKWGQYLKVNAVATAENSIKTIDDADFIVQVKNIKYLPGPQLPEKIANTFENRVYINRKLVSNERMFKYHGFDNRTGNKYTWVTNKKYSTEAELRKKLAIRDDWGVQIEDITEFDVPAGTWVSEGKAASQGVDYPGGDYQAVITNIPNAWIIKTNKAFK